MQDNESKINLSDLNKSPQPLSVESRNPLKRIFKKTSYPNRDLAGKFTGGSGGVQSVRKLKANRFIPFVAIIALVGGLFVIRSFATTSGVYDLRSFYPNKNIFATKYLEGNNYASGAPERSVLWFEPQDRYTYKMYNAAPQNADRKCNYDVLSWWDDATLRYSETSNDCGTYTANKVVYDAPIIFLPATWNSQSPWQLTGKSAVKYYEMNQAGVYVLRCTGTTNYIAKIFGIENVTPAEPAIHWQTTQITDWESGAVPGRCHQGYKTRWQEDYWMTTNSLKTRDGNIEKGIRRTKGGNLDAPGSGWDVWYDGWYNLPNSELQGGLNKASSHPYQTTPVGI